MSPAQSMHEGHRYFSAPRGDRTTGRFELTGGAEKLELLLLQPDSPSLVQAVFEGTAPQVEVVDGDVRVRYRRAWPFESRRISAEIALHPAVTWSVLFRRGVSKVKADLSRLASANVDIEGGASDVELLLPKPAGTMTVRVGGGASNALILRPAGVPLRVAVRGGAAHLHLDRLVLGAIGGPFEWETPDYATSSDRLELEIAGGVSHFTVGAIEQARRDSEEASAAFAP